MATLFLVIAECCFIKVLPVVIEIICRLYFYILKTRNRPGPLEEGWRLPLILLEGF